MGALSDGMVLTEVIAAPKEALPSGEGEGLEVVAREETLGEGDTALPSERAVELPTHAICLASGMRALLEEA